MKFTKNNQLKSNESASITAMPAVDLEKFDGLSINECIKRGLIHELGDDKGQFMFAHADANVDRTYALVNGKAVTVSSTLAATPADEVNEIIGDLRFTKGLSREKYKDGKIDENGDYVTWYRLGLPAGIRLGDATYSIEATAVHQ